MPSKPYGRNVDTTAKKQAPARPQGAKSSNSDSGKVKVDRRTDYDFATGPRGYGFAGTLRKSPKTKRTRGGDLDKPGTDYENYHPSQRSKNPGASFLGRSGARIPYRYSKADMDTFKADKTNFPPVPYSDKKPISYISRSTTKARDTPESVGKVNGNKKRDDGAVSLNNLKKMASKTLYNNRTEGFTPAKKSLTKRGLS